MRLFKGDYYSETLEFYNSFEGMTLTELDTDPDDGWYLGGSGTQQWSSFSTAPTDGARTGSKAVFLTATENINLYRSVTSGKEFVAKCYVYWDTADETLTRSFGFQLDEGADTDDILRMQNVNKPSTAIAVVVEFTNDPTGAVYTKLYLLSRFSGSPAVYTTEVSLTKEAWLSEHWVGLKLRVTEDAYFLYSDYNDTGTWELEAQGTWSNTATIENLTKFRIAVDGNATAGEELIIDDVFVSTITANSANEIKCTEIYCSKAENGGGSFQATLRDAELANYSTYESYLWNQCIIYNDDLSMVLFEGYITSLAVSLNHITLQGIETLRSLYRVSADTNCAVAAGEVTAIAGDTITDSNASFGPVNGKICMFTDATGPSEETIYLHSNSDHYQSDKSTLLTAYNDQEWGSYATTQGYDANFSSEDGWTINADSANFVCLMEFSVTNHATSTQFEIELRFAIYNETYNTYPKLEIYNDNLSSWEEIKTFTAADFSLANETNYVITALLTFSSSDLAASISDYFAVDGTLKLALSSGTPASGLETLWLVHAHINNTYSGDFTDAANTYYIIDSHTATTLTFTGQNPENDGVNVGDRYVVADYLHNNLDDIWTNAQISDLLLDRDTSTIADSTDYRLSYVADVLKNYADMMGAYLFQKIGKIVKLTATLEDSLIDLTESDIVNYHRDDWEMTIDANELIRKVKVSGGGITAISTVSPDYATPQTFLHTTQVSSQAMAQSVADELATKLSTTKKKYSITIIVDNNISNVENLDVMKTIDIDIASTITSTAAIIKQIHYRQNSGDKLYALLVVEEP